MAQQNPDGLFYQPGSRLCDLNPKENADVPSPSLPLEDLMHASQTISPSHPAQQLEGHGPTLIQRLHLRSTPLVISHALSQEPIAPPVD